MDEITERIVTTADLSKLFHVSERQIQRLVAGGVLDTLDNKKPYRFHMDTAVTQYVTFLESGIPLSQWAPDV